MSNLQLRVWTRDDLDLIYEVPLKATNNKTTTSLKLLSSVKYPKGNEDW